MSARQRKQTEQRAHKRAAKTAQKHKAHQRKQTPRNTRQRATQTPMLNMALGFKNKFTASLLRGRVAA